jgi:hypothetical protein
VDGGELYACRNLAENLGVPAVGFDATRANAKGSDEGGRDDTNVELELSGNVGHLKGLCASLDDDASGPRSVQEKSPERLGQDTALVGDGAAG